MTECPDDSVLLRIISGLTPDSNCAAVEQHLSTCADCQERLERLPDVKEWSSVLATGSVLRSEPSPSLRLVIERLQAGSEVSNGGDSALVVSWSNHGTLPELQPTRRDGYLGRLGDIDIHSVIGRGGMGVVFKGYDPALDRTVAVKVLAPHLVSDPEAKNRFLREARAAASLTHENVVAIHAIAEAVGMPYLVLQYVAGESLSERLAKREPLPFAHVLRIGLQTARGLAAAHAHGLIHRDIKPGNILLEGGSGNVRIADFGLAKQIGYESLTEVGVVAGTPAYMSPEQAEDGSVDFRTDLFALGVVLYQTASGKLPFNGDSPSIILNRIRSAEPEPLGKANRQLPEWFCSIVHRLLEKDPENRIGSAEELVKQFEQQSPAAPKKRGRIALFVGLALVALAGIAVIFFNLTQKNVSVLTSTVPTKPVPVGFVIEGTERSYPNLSEAIATAENGGTITIHGDGPYPSPLIRIENKKLVIRAASGSKPKFVPETGETSNGQFLSSNSDLVLQGISVDWPVAMPPRKAEESGTKSVVFQAKGKLTLDSCRLSCGVNGVCIVAFGQGLIIEKCHLLAGTGSSICIVWKPSAASVRIENSVLEGNVGLLLTQASSTVQLPGRVVFARNTVATERAVQIFPDTHIRQPMPITARGNIFDNKILVAMFAFRNFTSAIDTHTRMVAVLSERITWTDDGNIFRKGTLYLTGNRPSQLHSVVPSDFKKLDGWLQFWKQADSKSIEGVISFQARSEKRDNPPLELGRIEGASGPVPAETGANVTANGIENWESKSK